MKNQIVVFDIKRYAYFDGNIKLRDLRKIEIKLLDLLKITSQKGKFWHSSKKLPKDKISISNNHINVKKDEYNEK
ncbi:MAG TPA: hypothetical protein EYG97_02625 [Arcobacter sp.]|nr:hypothetical protein [Arcobacter sp.]